MLVDIDIIMRVFNEKTSYQMSINRGRTTTIKGIDGYYVAYKPITLPCILFMFIEMKFVHCYSCVMFAIKSMSMCND